ncbi:MAG: cytochrome c-type biogenesis protein [Rhodanobacter sp.]
MIKPFLLALFATLLLCGSAVYAQAIEPMPFTSHAQELRFQHLIKELRCPMCQDESLADSNAPIARDLRNQVFRLMQKGQTDQQIKDYLVARYSNYVLYDPPLQPSTWLLWFGPIGILLGGAGVVWVALKRRHHNAAEKVTNESTLTDNGDDW